MKFVHPCVLTQINVISTLTLNCLQYYLRIKYVRVNFEDTPSGEEHRFPVNKFATSPKYWSYTCYATVHIMHGRILIERIKVLRTLPNSN